MRKVIHDGDSLYTEDVFWVLFDYEVTRSHRYPSALTILQIVTAMSGSDEGLLRTGTSIFNTALNSHLRSADIATGNGKNYRVLLPTTDERGGRAVSERLLSIFRNPFEAKDGNSIIFTINIGMASHLGGTSLSKEAMLDSAGDALREAQLSGPNTFVSFSDLLGKE